MVTPMIMCVVVMAIATGWQNQHLSLKMMAICARVMHMGRVAKQQVKTTCLSAKLEPMRMTRIAKQDSESRGCVELHWSFQRLCIP